MSHAFARRPKTMGRRRLLVLAVEGLYSTTNLMNRSAYMKDGNGAGDRLSSLSEFRTNPGGLRALTYISKDPPAGTALVVVLHGWKQTAEEYDRGSGWSDLAARYGFALLVPSNSA
jgi:poly(3-hydroxybutyrate) depolymerase